MDKTDIIILVAFVLGFIIAIAGITFAIGSIMR